MGKHDDRNPAYWRKHARRYDRALRILNRRFGTVVALAAEDTRGAGDVLEVAAGTGLLTVGFAGSLAPGSDADPTRGLRERELAPGVRRVVATDRSPDMLAYLRTRLDAAGLGAVEVREADALATGLAAESFDVVVMANLLHLLPEPGLALAEARRVLRVGGRLVAPTFCHGANWRARLVSRILGLSGFPVVTRFRRGEVAALVGAHGFRVERSEMVRGLLPVEYVCARREA